jgi:hypothetical protein
MVSVGDRIRLTLNKGTAREGVVTRVTGSMLQVRWSSEEETAVVPAPGTLTVLGSTSRKAGAPSKKATAKPASRTKKAGSTKARSKKAGTTPRGSASKKVPSTKSTGTTSKAGTTKKPVAPKRTASKRSAR